MVRKRLNHGDISGFFATLPIMLHTKLFQRASHAVSITLLICALGLVATSFQAAAQYYPSAEEALIADFMVNDEDQQRPAMQLDPILSQVARERAEDMAARDYFAHVNPDGVAANYLVRQAGYELPAWWPAGDADNFIESIAAGRSSAAETWMDWMTSTPHRTHILALDPFYRDQTSYGVGYAYSATSLYRHYWVILTAPPNTPDPNSALVLSQNVPSGMIVGSTYNVSVSMLNTGSNTWTQSAGFQLASQAPADNSVWGLSRVNLPQNVAPGSTVTFNFTVTAPSSSGTSDFQWQMVQEGVGAFGQQTQRVPIAVSDRALPPPPPAAPYVAPAPVYSNYSAPSSVSDSSSKKKKGKKKKSKKKSKGKKKK